ncbi:hypothetical protein BJV82DRAFT_583620 [Fennellomyces sp. T-0311]|nr:hypothetical protein BJV82DRAFT_583620 [Fennellomyces sp. T-0311]
MTRRVNQARRDLGNPIGDLNARVLRGILEHESVRRNAHHHGTEIPAQHFGVTDEEQPRLIGNELDDSEGTERPEPADDEEQRLQVNNETNDDQFMTVENGRFGDEGRFNVVLERCFERVESHFLRTRFADLSPHLKSRSPQEYWHLLNQSRSGGPRLPDPPNPYPKQLIALMYTMWLER